MKLQSFILPADASAFEARLDGRKDLFDDAVFERAVAMFRAVRTGGDAEVLDATKRYDGVAISSVRVPAAFADAAIERLSPNLRRAIDQAASHIAEVNRAMMPAPGWTKSIRGGTTVGEIVQPLSSVGIWVPSRKGPLVSSALMLVVAAQVAGVARIVLACPPLANGLPDEVTVAAARLTGATEFVVGNGIAAIAALTFGTETVADVDGIFGPGPGAIAASMGLAFMYGKRTTIGIGPTDCVVVADDTADPVATAWDLANEAEHGPDSPAMLVTWSSKLAEDVARELRSLIEGVPEGRRKNLEHVFGPNGRGTLVVVPGIAEACAVVNDFAPEHLLINCEATAEAKVLDGIRAAGEILLGPWTPFSAANYAIGVTAVLPTNGYARAFSGITARDMLKSSQTARLTRDGLRGIWPTIETMADHEGLVCHREAAKVRLRT